jgi:hypothetical protein
MTDSKDFDDAIDSVARDLTAGDPPAHLSADVLARIDARRPTPWAWVAAATCASGIVAAVTIGLHDRGARRVTPEAHAGAIGPISSDPVAAGAPTPAPGLEPQAASLPPRIMRGAPRVTAIAPSADEVAWRGRAIPALQLPGPLTLNDIQPLPLEIRPLVTTPLAVPAIGEDDDRN